MSFGELNREFHFTDQDFEQVRRIIYRRAGIALTESKKQMVYSRLARRLRQHGFGSFREYLDMLEKNPRTPEWEEFTNALTTNLTAFFRESHHFDILRDHLARTNKDGHQLNLWSCASSTGEEPYSIAMTIMDLYQTTNPPARILASDLDTNVLAKARDGWYGADKVDKLPADKVRRYFTRGTGEHEGQFRVRPELQAMMVYRQINLLDNSWPIRGPFDAIFCRNVMIYFDKPTQRRILEKFLPLLRKDGLLFVGHSEHLSHVSDLYTSCGKTVYKLKEPNAVVAPPSRI